ncbi:MAG: hypothetical protein AAB320_09530 [Elusimicrobiota bacterium]
MAVVFLLGPGMWGPEKGASATSSPMEVRREIAKAFVAGGHGVILMEDEPDRKGEDMIQKFDRLLRSKVTDVVLYWPPLAKMQTTYDELILLYDRKKLLIQRGMPIWVLHHVSVASITGDEFKVLESGNRSRYLAAVARLGVRPVEWESDEDLRERAALLAVQLE